MANNTINDMNLDSKVIKSVKRAISQDEERDKMITENKIQNSSLSGMSMMNGIMLHQLNVMGQKDDFKFDLIDNISSLRGKKDYITFDLGSMDSKNEVKFDIETWNKVRYNKVNLIPFTNYKSFNHITEYDLKNTIYFLWCLASEYPVMPIEGLNQWVMPNILKTYILDITFLSNDGLLRTMKEYMFSLAVNFDILEDKKGTKLIKMRPCFNYNVSKDWKKMIKNQFSKLVMIDDDLDETTIHNNEVMDSLLEQYINSMRENLISRSIWFRCKTGTNIEDTDNWSREQWNELGNRVNVLKKGLSEIYTDKQLYNSLEEKPKIIKINKNTFDIVAEYNSRNECIEKEGMDKTSLSNVLCGRRKTYKGYAYKEVSNSKYNSFEDFINRKPDYDTIINDIKRREEEKMKMKEEKKVIERKEQLEFSL